MTHGAEPIPICSLPVFYSQLMLISMSLRRSTDYIRGLVLRSLLLIYSMSGVVAKTKFYSNNSHRFIQLSQNDSTQKHSWAYCRGEYTSFGWLFVYAKYTIRENCVQSAVRWVVTGRGKVRSERKFSVPYSRGLLLTECNELFTRNFAVKAEKIWQTNYGFKKLCSINTASKLKSRGRS